MCGSDSEKLFLWVELEPLLESRKIEAVADGRAQAAHGNFGADALRHSREPVRLFPAYDLQILAQRRVEFGICVLGIQAFGDLPLAVLVIQVMKLQRALALVFG